MSGRSGHRDRALVSIYQKEGTFLGRVLSFEYEGQKEARKWPLPSDWTHSLWSVGLKSNPGVAGAACVWVRAEESVCK